MTSGSQGDKRERLWAGSRLWGPPAQRGALQVWEGRWRVIPYDVLPDWLKDNDYLLHGHRPPMPSFRACFKSIFRIHTETGNIWTHLLGDWGRSVALGLRVGPVPTHKVAFCWVLGFSPCPRAPLAGCVPPRTRAAVSGGAGSSWSPAGAWRPGTWNCRITDGLS